MDAKRVRTSTDTLETPDGAALLMSIGDAKAQLGDREGALEEYAAAKRIQVACSLIEEQSAVPPAAAEDIEVPLLSVVL